MGQPGRVGLREPTADRAGRRSVVWGSKAMVDREEKKISSFSGTILS